MVRLKGENRRPLLHEHAFTFHYGKIKRTAHQGKGRVIALFTFHYGKIKSGCLSSTPRCSCCLHSTMVRLKGLYNRFFHERICGLHSTMVRLKGGSANLPDQREPRLHSTMVRLKGGCGRTIALTSTRLHSTMVRLKAGYSLVRAGRILVYIPLW